jgi:hypothetical protein
MKKSLVSLALAFFLSNWTFSAEPTSPPKHYAETTLKISEDYRVAVQTYDSSLSGKVDKVKLVFTREDSRSSISTPFYVYAVDTSQQGCHPDYTRKMTEEQQRIFSGLHNSGITNEVHGLVGMEVLRPISGERK